MKYIVAVDWQSVSFRKNSRRWLSIVVYVVWMMKNLVWPPSGGGCLSSGLGPTTRQLVDLIDCYTSICCLGNEIYSVELASGVIIIGQFEPLVRSDMMKAVSVSRKKKMAEPIAHRVFEAGGRRLSASWCALHHR